MTTKMTMSATTAMPPATSQGTTGRRLVTDAAPTGWVRWTGAGAGRGAAF
jgi:hypothetical protein